MQPRTVLTVLDLPSVMGHSDNRLDRCRPVVQFVRDWNGRPHRRGEMLASGEAPDGGSPADLALIAAVVQGLCELDGVPVPGWVSGHRLTPPATMTGRPLDTDWGRWVVSQAPAACFDHGVYFEAEMLAAQ